MTTAAAAAAAAAATTTVPPPTRTFCCLALVRLRSSVRPSVPSPQVRPAGRHRHVVGTYVHAPTDRPMFLVLEVILGLLKELFLSPLSLSGGSSTVCLWVACAPRPTPTPRTQLDALGNGDNDEEKRLLDSRWVGRTVAASQSVVSQLAIAATSCLYQPAASPLVQGSWLHARRCCWLLRLSRQCPDSESMRSAVTYAAAAAALSHRKIRLNGGYAGELASYYHLAPGPNWKRCRTVVGSTAGGRRRVEHVLILLLLLLWRAAASGAAGRQAAASIALSLAPSVRSFRRPREGGSYTAMLQLKSRRRTDGLAGCQDTHRQADRHGRGRPLARSLAASKGRPDRPTGGGRPGARKKGSVPSYTLNTRL